MARRAAAVDGDLRILPEPPLIVPLEELVAPGPEWEDSERRSEPPANGLTSRRARTYRSTI